MKRKTVWLGIALFASLIVLSEHHDTWAAQKTVKFKVPGITWASTGAAASFAARSVSGVTMADDDIINQKLTVTFDDSKTSINAITDGMRDANYPIDGEHEIVK